MKPLYALFGLLWLLATAQAHDYWLEPETFSPVPDKEVTVRLLVGDHFKHEDERSLDRKKTLAFRLHSQKDTVDLMKNGDDDKPPLARIKCPANGTYLLSLERSASFIKLEAAKFNKYLEEEGLDRVLTERKKAGEEDKPGREKYTRYLKCLLQVGPTTDETWKKVLGQKLEIVPLDNPLGCKVGDAITVRVLFDAKPLSGVRLYAYNRQGEKVRTQSLTTSEEGKATVKLDATGPWLIRLVHMQRCKDSEEADWESFWSALSFAP